MCFLAGHACSSRTALITGITGQDGSYLAELLLSKKYIVHGVIRRTSCDSTRRLTHLQRSPQFQLHYGDMTDALCLSRLLAKTQPDEVYNLAAQSDVKASFEIPQYTTEVNALGALHLLEALRQGAAGPKPVRFYQASTSELFGDTYTGGAWHDGDVRSSRMALNEKSPFCPCSPYAAAKLYAHSMTQMYRRAYGLFAVSGILFNHESPRRGGEFVTQKVVRAAVNTARRGLGAVNPLHLGHLDSRRDWGHAADYVRAMWLAMQNADPSDWVIASGEQHSVRELCEIAFKRVGIELRWYGTGVNEIGVWHNWSSWNKSLLGRKDVKDTSEGGESLANYSQNKNFFGMDGQVATLQNFASNLPVLICVNEKLFRPLEVPSLKGDASRARELLGWTPTISFKELIAEMVDAEIAITSG